VGCGRADIAGDWVGSASHPVELRLDAAKTFTLSVPAADELRGTWRSLRAEGSSLLELTVTSPQHPQFFGGQSVIAFEYVLKGDTLTLTQGFNREGEFQLHRKAQR
jgi:hypothetical protein